LSLSFFDFQENTFHAKAARRRAFRSGRMVRAFPAIVANTEIVSATANGGQPVTYMIDSGATYTILASTTATSVGFDTSNPSRQQAVTTVTGQTQANVFTVDFKINDTPAFSTEILVMESAFNLLSTEDLAKAYTVTLDPSGTGFHLTPLGQTPSASPTPTTPQVPQPTTQTLTVPKTGNVLMDFLRQIYHMVCGMTPMIPVICNNPSIFMAFLMLTVLAIFVLTLKGMFG